MGEERRLSRRELRRRWEQEQAQAPLTRRELRRRAEEEEAKRTAIATGELTLTQAFTVDDDGDGELIPPRPPRAQGEGEPTRRSLREELVNRLDEGEPAGTRRRGPKYRTVAPPSTAQGVRIVDQATGEIKTLRPEDYEAPHARHAGTPAVEPTVGVPPADVPDGQTSAGFERAERDEPDEAGEVLPGGALAGVGGGAPASDERLVPGASHAFASGAPGAEELREPAPASVPSSTDRADASAATVSFKSVAPQWGAVTERTAAAGGGAGAGAGADADADVDPGADAAGDASTDAGAGAGADGDRGEPIVAALSRRALREAEGAPEHAGFGEDPHDGGGESRGTRRWLQVFLIIFAVIVLGVLVYLAAQRVRDGDPAALASIPALCYSNLIGT